MTSTARSEVTTGDQKIPRPGPWTHPDGRPYTTEEKISFLQSERRDLLAQMRRSVHTARGDQGAGRRIDRIDAELAAIAKSTGAA